ncbi:hypothetical protein GH714_023945 [Hevea brasiliensis]|uniref:Uncharacterized protein n=1 Tax=Hevea brasiliensis TaxID=3981 RepID=A0A6A6LUQ5_HEVBR|nr:hypothetical protein GH714_023945 [Hevea brasiliensis]
MPLRHSSPCWKKTFTNGESFIDDDDDISEADFDKLQGALEKALRVTDDDDVEILSSAVDDFEDGNADKEEEEERPIKSLAAELCLDRAVVLELLRDTLQILLC